MRLLPKDKRTLKPLAALQADAAEWARDLWTGAPETTAAIVQVGHSAHNRKTVNRQHQQVRAALAQVATALGAGERDPAEAIVAGLAARGVDWIHWCDDETALGEVLTECLWWGECCYDDGVFAGPAGSLVWAAVWYDRSHPV